jgi:hypothetical protein
VHTQPATQLTEKPDHPHSIPSQATLNIPHLFLPFPDHLQHYFTKTGLIAKREYVTVIYLL